MAILLVPFYIKYLGLESYGLITFYTSIVVFLQILDFGISQTVIGEISRSLNKRSKQKIANLIHTLAFINIIIALIIIATFFIFSEIISEKWFNASENFKKKLPDLIILVGLLIGVRWPILIYQGALYGCQKIKEACLINISMVSINSFGTLIILINFNGNLSQIFIWQILIGLIYTLTIRNYFWKLFGNINNKKLDFLECKRIWKYGLKIAFVTTSAILLSQLDKIIVSKLFTISVFGIYMLCSNMANIIQLIINPLYNILYPKFSELYSNNKKFQLFYLYKTSLKFVISVLFPIASFTYFCSYELVYLYTNDTNIAKIASPILSLLIISSTLNGIMYIYYTLQLGISLINIILLFNFSLLILNIPLLIFLSNKFGIEGAAASWLIVNLIYFILCPIITHRKIFKTYLKHLYIHLLKIFILFLIIITIINIVIKYLDDYLILKFISIFVVSFIFFFINVLISKELRKYFFILNKKVRSLC